MDVRPRIRVYGRQELAQEYNPRVNPEVAWRRLKGWIALNKQLSQALQEAGYNPEKRLFTPKQVALIFEYLGEP